MTNYQQLKAIFQCYYSLDQINGILSWDRQVMMPKKGFEIRKAQQILLDDLANETICDPNVGQLIADCDPSNLSAFEQRDFALMKKIFIHKTAIPQKLQQSFTKLGLETEFIWAEAKANNDFKNFNKSFKKLVEMVREIASIKSEILGVTAYEALIDQYDEGRKEQELDELFAKLSKDLPPLIDQIIAQQQQPTQFLNDYPIALQKQLGLKIMKQFGADDSWCRADESAHPFSSSEPGDGRITTRYIKGDFISGLMAFIHETGHALYDNNRPLATMFQPIGQFQGMALHESQSLFLEMQIGRSRSFCEFLAPQICEIFSLKSSACNAQTLFNNINFVQKSYIRVDADEATYPLHVMLRYEIEKALIYKEVETDDLPEIWNEKLAKYLGLNAPEISKGVLQDIHWSDGTFGYFPTYSLGAIYAANIAVRVKQLIPNYDALIAQGQFGQIINCLKEHIHQKAASKNAQQIVQDFCGFAPNADVFIDYLKGKYLAQ
ncbi:MAG: carboxypeptidase M32 [Proteobacteria bacterium]|nr:carboxypeptidase M32 [Pseudomonadota bacterium]